MAYSLMQHMNDQDARIKRLEEIVVRQAKQIKRLMTAEEREKWKQAQNAMMG